MGLQRCLLGGPWREGQSVDKGGWWGSAGGILGLSLFTSDAFLPVSFSGIYTEVFQ
jgi:hypothetical protein